MTKIISFVQLKGGVGRSTLATNLAGTIAENASVAIIDCDSPQFTSTHWLNQRRKLYDIDEKLDLYQTITYKALLKLVHKLHGSYDYIVIDCPPRLDGLSKTALMIADIVLLPLGTSAAEIWSVEAMIKTLNEASKINKNLDVRIIWNRYRGNTKSAKENTTNAKKDLKLPELRQKISMRVAYSDAMAEGLTVHETNDKSARVEMWSLCSSIQRILFKQTSKTKLSDEKILSYAKT